MTFWTDIDYATTRAKEDIAAGEPILIVPGIISLLVRSAITRTDLLFRTTSFARGLECLVLTSRMVLPGTIGLYASHAAGLSLSGESAAKFGGRTGIYGGKTIIDVGKTDLHGATAGHR